MSDGDGARVPQAPAGVGPAAVPPPPPTAPQPDESWSLPGGMAWVYYAAGRSGLVAPIILSDGFLLGPSNLDVMYANLDIAGFHFITALREEGRDVVLLGYQERSASILDNAAVAAACIQRAAGEKRPGPEMVVGGFSMGGLVTRYALARMECDGIDHGTSTYVSYDTPHRGAWSPIGVQALAHFFQDPPYQDWPSRQINAPAARQQVIHHIATADQEPISADPMRTQLLDALHAVGWFPRRPRTLGVANGRADGVGNGIAAGEVALTFTGTLAPGTSAMLRTQGASSQPVAELRSPDRSYDRYTADLPPFDGAPGSTLDSFGMMSMALSPYGEVQETLPPTCFVPTASAVSIRDADDPGSLFDPIPQDEKGDLDAFKCASDNQMHCLITDELCTWILDQLAD